MNDREAFEAWMKKEMPHEPLEIIADSGVYLGGYVQALWVGYQAGLASQAQQESQWISVEERLPDTDNYVFVYMPNNNYLKIGIDCWQMQKESPLSFSSQTVDIGMGWDDNEFEDVSHWMPLPPAPEGEKP